MKKVILSLLLLGALTACKKETAITETQSTETVDSAAVEPVAASNVSLAEINNDQLAGLMKVQQNDTVYVTNFFATWCRPCMAEIPHFKEKLEATKDQKIKFTFVSVDAKEIGNINGVILLYLHQAGQLIVVYFCQRNI